MASNQVPKKTIPGFKVLKTIGNGTYGKVYKVQRQENYQVYAIKEINIAALDLVERKDALNEVRLLVSINHVNVVGYHEAFTHGNKLYIVMEYCKYGSLGYYIKMAKKRGEPFPEEMMWRLMLQLCNGLEALHIQDIIHRDIKPDNIFLGQNDLLKIGDLGIAKALRNARMAYTAIGTPAYMAPEIWSQEGYSFSSDLWSLGALLYEMMMLRKPYEATTIMEMSRKVGSGQYTRIPAGQFSDELRDLCHSLLELNPYDRPTLAEILSSKAAQRWQFVLAETMPTAPLPSRGASFGRLMETIRMPKDLSQLHRVLPPPCY